MIGTKLLLLSNVIHEFAQHVLWAETWSERVWSNHTEGLWHRNVSAWTKLRVTVALYLNRGRHDAQQHTGRPVAAHRTPWYSVESTDSGTVRREFYDTFEVLRLERGCRFVVASFRTPTGSPLTQHNKKR